MASTRETGLTTEDAERRLADVGPNLLVPEMWRPTALHWLVVGLIDPMVVLLLIAGVAYVIPIAAADALREVRAEHVLDRLNELTALTVTDGGN